MSHGSTDNTHKDDADDDGEFRNPESRFLILWKRREHENDDDANDTRDNTWAREIAKANGGCTIWNDDSDVLETDEGDEETNTSGDGELQGLRNVTNDPTTEWRKRNDKEEKTIDEDDAHGLSEIKAHAKENGVSDQRVDAKTTSKTNWKASIDAHNDSSNSGTDCRGSEDASANLIDSRPGVAVNQNFTKCNVSCGIKSDADIVGRDAKNVGPIARKHVGVEWQNVEHCQEDDETAHEFADDARSPFGDFEIAI